MIKSIPYGKHSISEQDIQNVVKVLKSDYLTQGPVINEFEKCFADYIGSKFTVAVSNGTAALHLSALVMDIKPGDKVITTPITFAATANCVRYAGGEVIFSDIDPNTFLLDINKVESVLKRTQNVKGIIPVDFAGYPVNMEEYRFLADKYNLWIIEDACHAPGGFFIDSKGLEQKCGNNTYSELSIFSFHPVKHIACGEGGMISTNNFDFYERLQLLRSHGITKSDKLMQDNHGSWYYEMQELGYNYRLSDIHAALGKSQLEKADDRLKRRTEIAEKYTHSLNALAIKLPRISSNISHAWHLYVILSNRRDELYYHLHKNNIFAQVHYIPVHLQPYYRQLGWKKGDMPIAENYYEKCLSLPIFPALTENEQHFVIKTIKEFFDG